MVKETRPESSLTYPIEDHKYIENRKEFEWGFLTHGAPDIVFHPVVFYFSGYAPQDDPISQLRSKYRHLHYETIIDRHFNKGTFLENITIT